MATRARADGVPVGPRGPHHISTVYDIARTRGRPPARGAGARAGSARAREAAGLRRTTRVADDRRDAGARLKCTAPLVAAWTPSFLLPMLLSSMATPQRGLAPAHAPTPGGANRCPRSRRPGLRSSPTTAAEAIPTQQAVAHCRLGLQQESLRPTVATGAALTGARLQPSDCSHRSKAQTAGICCAQPTNTMSECSPGLQRRLGDLA